MKKRLLLVVEDDSEMKKTLFGKLSKNGYSISLTENREEALKHFEQNRFDLVIADVRLPDGDGLQFLESIKSRSFRTPVIMISGLGTIQNAVEAMRKGASDYILKPFSLEHLEQRIQMALHQNLTANDDSSCKNNILDDSMPVITKDKRMKDIMDLCNRIASSRASVLIQGESGTGKELFARYIHSRSPRYQGPFVAINCASLPESLFESELFGHEKGAFTGAVGKKIGKFELAHQGTILLDEISEMSPFLQAKILRVLQENEVDRIGGREPVPVDVRVIATTNRNLETSIEKGEFREDLYFRINVVWMVLPPLREREEDIELLTRYFLGKYSKDYGKPEQSISEEALIWLKNQPWRGNVRELRNVIERAVLIASQPVLDLEDLNPKERLPMPIPQERESNLFPLSLREMEKKLIFKALEKTNGNRTHAAKALGISIRTLRNKLHEYKDHLTVHGA